MLFKKLIRTAGRYKAQFISMIIMTALGIGMFLGFNMEWVSINENTFRFFDDTGFADYRIMSEDGLTAEDAEAIAAIDGVDSVSRFFSVNADVNGLNGTLAVTVTENPDVSSFVLLDGEEYDSTSPDGIWLFDRFAAENDLSVGDTLELTYDKFTFKGRIAGLIESAEYLICIQDETQLMPDFDKYGYCYISPVMLENTVNEVVQSEVHDEVVSSLNEALMEGYDKAASELAQLANVPGMEEVYKAGMEQAEEIREKAEGLEQMSDAEIDDLLKEYTEDSLEELRKEASTEAMENVYHQINVISGLDKAEFKDSAKDALGKTLVILTRDENVSYAESQGEVKEGKTMGAILPVLFLLISVLTMVTTMHRISTSEKTQIGTLKALGFKDRRILLHYSSYALFIGIVGSVLGIALGYLVCWIIMNPNGMMGTYFSMPTWDLVIPWWALVIIVVMILFMFMVGWLSTRKMLKGSAAEALRPFVPEASGAMLIERTKLWEKMRFGSKWNLRDIMRHKSRSAVTLIGVMGCMVLMVAAIGMYETAGAFVKMVYTDNARYESRAFIADSVSEEEAEELARDYNADYSAQISVQMDEDTYSLDIYHLENDLIKFMDADGRQIELTDDSALISMRIAEKHSLSAGDIIRVSPYSTSEEYEIKVGGICRSMAESIIISDAYAEGLANIGEDDGSDVEYLKDSDRYRISSIYTTLEKSEINDPAFSAVQSKRDIVESMDNFMEILNTFVVVLVVAAIVLGIVVLYNLGVMSYTERYREMATLKVVGFRDSKLKGLLVGQSIWITVVGIIVGFFAGYGILVGLMKALAAEYEMKVVIGVLTIVISVAVTFLVSLIVGLMVSRKCRKIDMVDALKIPE